MHVCGNDFVIINNLFNNFRFTEEEISNLGNRNTGIGFDQMLVLRPPINADEDFYYDIYNQDGSTAKQCGNGVRSLCSYIWHNKLVSLDTIKLRTCQSLVIARNNKQNETISIDMGKAKIEPEQIPTTLVNNASFYFTPEAWQTQFNIPKQCFAVAIGNPHLVFFIENFAVIQNIENCVAEIQASKYFAEGVNISFVEKVQDYKYFARVFERGVGETMACGTACCAISVAVCLQQQANFNKDLTITMHNSNNEANIAIVKQNLNVTLSGKASYSFSGFFKYSVMKNF